MARFSFLLSLTSTVCQAVGVNDVKKIPDDRITASSIAGSTFYPYYGRMGDSRGSGYGWCAATTSGNDYLQVDMGHERRLCSVETQGSKHSHWVKSYKLSLSKDGANWITYKEQNSEKVCASITNL